MLMNELNSDLVMYLSIGAVVLTAVVGLIFSIAKRRIKEK
jgi:type III secretory pathway component EscS